MEEDVLPEGEWFCSEECRMVHELSLSWRKKITRLIWRGLNDKALLDAVKENDGPRMPRYWKFDLFEFYERNHLKYLIYDLRLFAKIA
ncbi:hypothetical protein ACJMK2_034371 [Sinanodonta woodiana]|uniref:Uncharacterized protein n=1 Tax=Sinanodonta woodiana TaxID=1069815 RepID=A0ABD3WRB9_SINWO